MYREGGSGDKTGVTMCACEYVKVLAIVNVLRHSIGAISGKSDKSRVAGDVHDTTLARLAQEGVKRLRHTNHTERVDIHDHLHAVDVSLHESSMILKDTSIVDQTIQLGHASTTHGIQNSLRTMGQSVG